MSDDIETPNEFAAELVASKAAITGEGERLPETPEIGDAVRKAISEQGMPQVQLAPCPCGVASVSLMIDIEQGSKVGRATCGSCGIWGVDFLAPRSKDQGLLGKSAAQSWNEAPRLA